jgi:hypothetical protein
MAMTWKGTMSITPITGFKNQGAQAPYKQEATYALGLLPALDNIEIASNHLAQESIMESWNLDQYLGLEGIDPREQLAWKTL